jgi:predicted transposase YbfD/YdcC
VETRSYLTSLPSDAGWLNSAVRSHWGMENSLHWVLDVTFDEDRSWIKAEHQGEATESLLGR